jgi:hypothetical protein
MMSSNAGYAWLSGTITGEAGRTGADGREEIEGLGYEDEEQLDPAGVDGGSTSLSG